MDEKKELKPLQNDGRKRTVAYGGIIFVVFVWGSVPLFTNYLRNYYSGAIYTAMSALVVSLTLFLICIPKLKYYNKDYLKVAVPTGLFYSLANIFQKVGLPYTTPTKYAFLENLSCLVVPVLMYFFIKKKPGVLTIISSVMCLIGCFVLSGISFSGDGFKIGLGEILCALAGIFYGVNIAGTGAFAKKLYAPMYVMTQMIVNAIIAFPMAIAFNYIKINGAPIDPIKFTWDAKLIFAAVSVFLISSTLCWIIRTNSMKYVNASVVAVMMPFSAVITSIGSIIIGTDELTANLIIGGVIVLISAFMSSLDDILENRKARKAAAETVAAEQNSREEQSPQQKTE